MTKEAKIKLVLIDFRDYTNINGFRVDSLTNSIEWTCNSKLTKEEVQKIISERKDVDLKIRQPRNSDF